MRAQREADDRTSKEAPREGVRASSREEVPDHLRESCSQREGARAKQQYEKGNLSYRKYMQVVARANAYIKKCTGAVCRGATCSTPVKKATVSKSEEKRRLNAALKGV